MTTLPDRPNTALMVIDVQKDVVDGAYERETVIANIASLVDKARAESVPVVWVAHSDDEMPRDSDAWQYVPELVRLDAEPLVHKSYGDAFEGTDLEEVLAGLQVGRLVVTGAQSEECIRSTIHGAFTRGYDVTLVSDAHTTCDYSEYGSPKPEVVVSFTNLYWEYHSAPGRTGGIVATADVDFSGADAA